MPARPALQERLQSLLRVLEEGSTSDVERTLTHAEQVKMGQELFDVLFGDQKTWTTALRQAWEWELEADPTPARRPLHVRIREILDDQRPPLTDHLPWRITAYQGITLSLAARWRFEVCPHLGQPRDVHLRVPAPILFIVPEQSEPLEAIRVAHIEALKGIGDRAGLKPDEFKIATTRREIETWAQYLQPNVVYYFGHASTRRGQIGVILNGDRDGDFVPMADLARLLGTGGAQPDVVYLNGCRTALGTHLGPARLMVPAIPVAVAQSSIVYSYHAAHQAEVWLDKLWGGSCPIEAIHHLDDIAPQAGFDWASSVVATHVRRVHVDQRTPGADEDSKRLDRIRQRETAASEADRLALAATDNKALKATALIGIGGPRDRPELFGDQLLEHVRKNLADRVTIRSTKILRLQFGDGFDVRTVSAQVLAHFGFAEAHASFAGAIRARFGPGAPPPRLLWLDFQVYGHAGIPMLTGLQLKTWWALVADELAGGCPADTRVIALITLCPKNVGKLESGLADLENDVTLNPDRFRVRILESLHFPLVSEIRDELREDGCDATIAFQLAPLMHKAAVGSYQALFELMQRVRKVGCRAVLEELSGSAPKAEDAAGDEEF